MELKYVNLNNFRFLTGHGKQFAYAVDAALNDWDHATSGEVIRFADLSRKCPSNAETSLRMGVLLVCFSPSQSTFEYNFFPTDTPELESLKAETAERYPDHGHWHLMCVLRDGGRTELTDVPLATILRGSRDYTNHYQVYSHNFIVDENKDLIPDPNVYVGVTKRGWRERWREHVRSAKNGSHYRFHEAIRTHHSAFSTSHGILGLYQTEALAMDAEEKLVGFESLYPLGLNMIPGGYAGMRFLHRIGAVGKGERVSPDQKYDFINRFFETASRKGTPNPFIAANWQDSEYAERVICGGPDRLKPSQIREARYLKTIGMDAEEIKLEIGAKNSTQVQRLLSGDTYSRIA